MGSCAYDFLLDSFLSNQQEMADLYAGYDENELRKELYAYRQHVLQHIDDDIRCTKGSHRLNVLLETNTKANLDQFLKQSALYQDTVFIPDPIFEYTVDQEKEADYCIIGHIKKNPYIDRAGLVKAVKSICALSPCFRSSYVVFVPTTILGEPPDGWPQLTINSDLFTKDMIRYYRNQTVLRNADYSDGNYIPRLTRNLQPGPAVEIRLPKDGDRYLLVRTGFDPSNPEVIRESKQEFNNNIDSYILSVASYEINSILNELKLAEYMDSVFLATREYTADVLQMSIGEPSNKGRMLDLSLEVDLSIAANLSLEDLMHLRWDYGEAFASFRSEYKKDLEAISILSNDISVQRGIRMIEEKYADYSRSLGEDIKKGCVSLGLSALLSGLTLISSYPAHSILNYAAPIIQTSLTGIQTLKSIANSPNYFAWQLNRRNTRKGVTA